MNIIEKYLPLNSIDKIKGLIDELKTMPNSMSPFVRQQIFMNINKAKLAMKFNDAYPESMFTGTAIAVPVIGQETSATSVSNEPTKKSTVTDNVDYLPNETKGDKKFIYGTYIEMAFHNFYLTMHHIYSIVFGEDVMKVGEELYNKNSRSDRKFEADYANEKYIWKPMFERFNLAKPEERDRLNELFFKHFPFLKALDALESQKRVTPIEALKRFSKSIRELRNYYAHYLFKPYDEQIETYTNNEAFIFSIMDILYTGAKREVKSRFAYSDKKMDCAEKFEPNHDRSITDSRGIMKKVRIKKNFKYSLSKSQDDRKVISVFGLVFLASLFLEKKYSKIFADKTHCVNYADQDVICEMLAVYRIRLHVQKLTVSKSTDALALDIINELQRCPKDLFEMLPPEKQKEFRYKPATPSDPEVLMVRKSDRFAHLCLKYLDDAKVFDSIRFHVALGKYFFKFYNKMCIDNTSEPRVRALSKDIHGFGRLSDIEDYRKAVYGELIRDFDETHVHHADDKPYITDHRAKYLIKENKIGLLIRNYHDTSCVMPELNEDGARNVVPTCWMSTYELPALAFLLHLYNGDGSRIEEIIKIKVANQKRLFNDIKDGLLKPVGSESDLLSALSSYGVHSLADIPKNMKDYLLYNTVDTKEIFNGWAKSELERMIVQSEKRLEHIKDDLKMSQNIKQNKFGKKTFVRIKPGRIADFMARDIMFFQPYDDDHSKLTSLNFRIMQAVLALYDGNFDDLTRLLRNAHVIGDANDEFANPIIMGVWRKHSSFSSLTDFYIAYLKERIVYLKKCISEQKFDTLTFLHADRSRWNERTEEFYRALAARYLKDEYEGTKFEKGIELPRGLFDPYIRNELAEIASMKDLASDQEKNISYLIYGYFKNVMDDDTQPFYEERRSYPIFNKLFRKSPRDPKVYRSTKEIRDMLMRKSDKSIRKDIAKYLDRTIAVERIEEEAKLKRLLSNMKNQETEFKQYKIQDIILFLFAKRILLDSSLDSDNSVEFEAFNNIKLSQITSGDTLSQKISIKIKLQDGNGNDKVLTQDDLKLKNYAQFYAILNDRRLPSLLDLIQRSLIRRADIEAELTNYDKVHPSILENVFRFEKEYVEAHEVDIDKIPNLSQMLEDSTDLDFYSRMDVKKIRNSFSHLTYPDSRVSNIHRTDLPQKAKILADTLESHLKKN